MYLKPFSSALIILISGVAINFLISFYSVKPSPISLFPSEQEVDSRLKAALINDISAEDRDLMSQQIFHENLVFLYGLSKEFHRHDDVIVKRLLKNLDFISSSPCEHFCLQKAIDLDLQLYDPVVKARIIQLVDLQLKNAVRSEGYNFYIPIITRELKQLISFNHCYFSFGSDLSNLDKVLQRAEKDKNIFIDSGLCPSADIFFHSSPFEDYEKSAIEKIFGSEFAEQLFFLGVGSPASILTSSFGYHLISVTNKKEQAADLKTMGKSEKAQQLYQKRKERLLKMVAGEYGVDV